jgi:hypothetical protein
MHYSPCAEEVFDGNWQIVCHSPNCPRQEERPWANSFLYTGHMPECVSAGLLRNQSIAPSDMAGPKAKAGLVGCLCPTGGKEGYAEDSRETAEGIQQAPALRDAS